MNSNLFGTSPSAIQITRPITAGNNILVGSDKFLNFDRADGNITLELPNLANFLDANSKSGNTINLNYILSDLTSGVSQNTITLVCDSADNINGKSSFVTDINGRYNLQATPSGWLMINQAGSPTATLGIFNLGALAFSADVIGQDLSQYYAVIIQNGFTIGADYTYANSAILKYWAVRLNSDTVSLAYKNNSLVQKIDWFNSAVLVNAVFEGNPSLTYISIKHQGGGNGVLANVSITGSPLLNDVNFSDNALTVNSVDGILAYLDSTGVINGSVVLDNGTNATPTGGGANPNVVSLLSKGWTVTTN